MMMASEDATSYTDEEYEMWDKLMNPQGSPANNPSTLAGRKIANNIPPSMANVIWGSIISPEPCTGVDFLNGYLAVHDAIPSLPFVRKLMDMMKYGPSNAGSSVYYKDPHKTNLVSRYVHSLVSASSRLVRQGDNGALFGPTSWDDIDCLLSQSIVQTENSTSGQPLAHGLQLAARGASLLSLMLTTELQGENLFSTESTLHIDKLKSMPTVRLIQSYSARNGLKAASQHVARFLVRHSKWVLDHGGSDAPFPIDDQYCFREAALCWDNLGSVLAVFAWLFCVDERKEMKDPACAHIVKDVLLVEMQGYIGEVPEMNAQRKKRLVKNMTTYFISNICKERFATPMAITLGKMVGIEDDLALWGLIPPSK